MEERGYSTMVQIEEEDKKRIRNGKLSGRRVDESIAHRRC
jgi:hypothetical protein